MTVICSSSDPQQLRALLTVFDPTTIRGVISFGVAGGLDPALKSGDVVVATEVLAGDTRFLAASALNEQMIASVAPGIAARASIAKSNPFSGTRLPTATKTGPEPKPSIARASPRSTGRNTSQSTPLRKT